LGGSRTGVVHVSCELQQLERSELFYRIGDASLKVSVTARASAGRVFLWKIHCDRSAKPTKAVDLRNCEGKWPLVTQTGEFEACPWGQ
jgi:hypothetical protein